MGARAVKQSPLDGLLYDECKRAIQQARMTDRDSDIAELYLVNRMAQSDVAATLGIARSTISRRLPAIESRIEYVARKLGYI